MEIYQPAEDSLMFTDFLKKYLSRLVPTTNNSMPQPNNKNWRGCQQPTAVSSMKMLDMGTGSGILAKTALEFLSSKNITAVDINPDAVKELEKEKFKVVQSDLFSQITSHHPIKFDLIVFNAPYLPLDPREPKSSRVATTGGKRGDEIAIKFLKQAKKHLDKNGKILLLISSLTPMDRIEKFKPKIVARKKVFMEELRILEIE